MALPEQCVLLTGFDPFGGEPVNPSAAVVQALQDHVVAGMRVMGAVLPVSFARARRQLRALLRAHQPVAVLALGQAGGRAEIGLERVALNLIDARIADADGAQPLDVPVLTGAPAARFSTAPLKSMLARARAAGWPVGISLSAGSYVCNALYFHLLQALRRRPSCPAVFVHLPWLPEQAVRQGGPALDLATQVDVVRGLLQVLVQPAAVSSTLISGGSEH